MGRSWGLVPVGDRADAGNRRSDRVGDLLGVCRVRAPRYWRRRRAAGRVHWDDRESLSFGQIAEQGKEGVTETKKQNEFNESMNHRKLWSTIHKTFAPVVERPSKTI